jgi:hypothetical protein
MLPNVSNNKKALQEIKEYTEMISKISNPRLKKDVHETIKKLKKEYEMIDSSLQGDNGYVSPDIARESVMRTIDYRKYLKTIKERLER